MSQFEDGRAREWRRNETHLIIILPERIKKSIDCPLLHHDLLPKESEKKMPRKLRKQSVSSALPSKKLTSRV